jgi:hypothetical protein
MVRAIARRAGSLTTETGDHPMLMLDDAPIRTILDRRVPQPGEYEAYHVPPILYGALEALYQERKTCPATCGALIDNAILRILLPWIRFEEDRTSSD